MIKVHINRRNLNCTWSSRPYWIGDAPIEEIRHWIKSILSSNNPRHKRKMLQEMSSLQQPERYPEDPVDLYKTYELYKNDLDTFLDQFDENHLRRMIIGIWEQFNTELEREVFFKNIPKALDLYWGDDYRAREPGINTLEEKIQHIDNVIDAVSRDFNISREQAITFLKNIDSEWYSEMWEYNAEKKRVEIQRRRSQNSTTASVINQFKELLDTSDSTESIEYDRSYRDVALLFLADGVEKTEAEMKDIFNSYNGDINAFLSDFTAKQLQKAYKSFVDESTVDSIAQDYSLKTSLDFKNIILKYGTRLKARRLIAPLLGITEQDAKALLSEMY